mmetsp:Transcript_35301/g.51882  ORF Transcript_35301/g.51882 Transcript_35301/m.51882 type:complete len:365 (-) Transcript_35301:203-1297(-)|eukprot:CAMPEP_0195528050 /NCGR_PEP_ID=MMETSP0794_2-20130614/30031_1 /TAXON_ID=515487 /ORGANISM="Stephanopyxis turris, Strain CCMP 815" /LENGTH=364 /DNA_ID=CAMNT_0040659099 /DNA_START=179 /DNA_END=1273 /DNA_ORIENTATION=+
MPPMPISPKPNRASQDDPSSQNAEYQRVRLNTSEHYDIDDGYHDQTNGQDESFDNDHAEFLGLEPSNSNEDAYKRLQMDQNDLDESLYSDYDETKHFSEDDQFTQGSVNKFSQQSQSSSTATEASSTPQSITEINPFASSPRDVRNDEDDGSDDENRVFDRYNFSPAPHTPGLVHESSFVSTTPGIDQASLYSAIKNGNFASVPYLLSQIQMESRRKRAQRALEIEDSDTRGNILLCLSAWCDLCEFRGMVLVLMFVIAIVGGYKWMEKEGVVLRHLVMFLGIVLVLIRVFWWPIYWYLWGERVQRRRQATMELYDGLNGEAAAGCEITSHIQRDYNNSFDYDEERLDLGMEMCEETGHAGIVV